MKQWNTPQLLGTSSGSEDKLPVGFEFFIFGELQEDPEGES